MFADSNGVPPRPRSLLERLEAIERRLDKKYEIIDATETATSLKLELPESIYVFAPFNVASRHKEEVSSAFFWLLFSIPCWLLLFLVFGAQFSALYYVKGIGEEIESRNCHHNAYLLRLVCVFTYTSLIWTDIWETIIVSLYIVTIPRVHSWTGMTKLLKDVEAGEIVAFHEGEGMMLWFKTFTFLVVIVPKLLLALGLWYYGTRFLAHSRTNEDMLVNAVTLIFITEIDNYFYQVIPNAQREEVIEDMPILRIGATDEADTEVSLLSLCLTIFHQFLGGFVYPALIVCGTVVAITAWC